MTTARVAGKTRTVSGFVIDGDARDVVGTVTAGDRLRDRNLRDAFTHWWTVPRAVEVGGRSYIGSIMSDGRPAVTTVKGEQTTRTVFASTHAPDDHHAPALLIDAKNPPVILWSEHNFDKLVKVKTGAAVGVLPTADTVTTTATFPNLLSYQQAFRRADGEITVFCRNQQPLWRAAKSSDNGATWGTAFTVFDFTDNLGYMLATQSGDVIHCGLFTNPVLDGPHDIWYVNINLTTGVITDIDGNVLANMDGTNLPIDVLALTPAIAAAGNDNTRLLAVADGKVAYASWQIGTQAATRLYQVAEYDGDDWNVSSLGDPGVTLDPDTGNTQFGGMAFTDDGDVYLSREDDGTWTIEKWADSAGWALDEITATSATRKLVRPTCPVGALAGPPVFWFAASAYTSGEDWSSDLAY